MSRVLAMPALSRHDEERRFRSLTECIVLSLLLHVLLVVTFGTPAGSDFESVFGVNGALSVVLRPRTAIRAVPSPAPAAADRARVAPLIERSAPARPVTSAESPAPSVPAAAPIVPPSAPVMPTPEETLPRFNPGAPAEVDKRVVPTVDLVPFAEKPVEAAPRAPPKATKPVVPIRAAPDLPVHVIPQEEIPAQRSLETVPASPAIAPAAAVPQGEAPSRPLRAPAPPAEPVVPVQPEQRAEPPVAPIEIAPQPDIAATPSLERERIPLIEAPPLPAPQMLPTSRIEEAAPREVAPVTPAVIAPSPPIAPAEVTRPAETVAPRDVTPLLPPAVVAPPTTQLEAPAGNARPLAPPAAEALRPGAPSVPTEAPGAPGPSRLNFGPRPTVDEDLRELVEPGYTAQPRPDNDAARRAVREANRLPSYSPGVFTLNLTPPQPDPQTKLGRAIQKAAQPDCRNAYAGLGLLAVPMLLADAITERGCQW